MYAFDWAQDELWGREEQQSGRSASRLDRDRVDRTLLLHWQEHCVECAPPDCYASCPLYVERADRKCARFVYGIAPNPAFRGLLDVGADIRFRRWAKLEAIVGATALTPQAHRRLATVDHAVTRVARALAPADSSRLAGRALAVARDRLLPHVPNSRAVEFDDFVLECYAPDEEPFRLVLEWDPVDRTTLRHAFEIRPGHNLHSLPASAFGTPVPGGRIRVFPEADAERRLVFTWLDFVRYRQRPAPADLVKCVAWDLDGTLWDGILIEDGPDRCGISPGVEEIVRALDERGVLQTVVSKNDHDDAWEAVERTGLADFFLYPQISWGPKSAGIRRAAERLNIGIDTFALVDDSPFERAEVTAALPMVRVYDTASLERLLALPELDVPVTETARNRRNQYRTRIERERAEETFSGGYLDFLRGCRLELRVLRPHDPAQIDRCLELVQRSNQLNLSKRAYERSEFESLLQTPGILSIALDAEDRFGSYGIVGFVAVDERAEPTVRDFVLSCRVAQKHVEHAFFGWLADREAARGARVVRAELVRTTRNGPLQQVFADLPFVRSQDDGDRVLYELSLPATGLDDVVTVRDLVAA